MGDVSNETKMAEMYQLDVNSNEMCRNCLARNCPLKSLFRCDIVDGEIWPVPKVYESVTNISIVENDSFPQNICTKCESTMFEAFAFKQKSAKSHKLLQQILKIPQDEENKAETNELAAGRTSQSTQTNNQTNNSHDVRTTNKATKFVSEKPDDNPLKEDEDEDMDAIWQMIYESNADNEDSVNEPDEKEVENNEIDEVEDENATFFECEHCGENVSSHHIQEHLKQHTKILPYLLNSIEFFRCSRCLTIFPFIDHLFDHMNADQICESYELENEDLCTDYQFLSNDPPVRLVSASKNVVTNSFSCSVCHLNFDDLLLFQTHFEEEHLTNTDCNPEYLRAELIHSCGICGNSFKHLHDTLHHVYFHQAEYPCLYDDCELLFSSFSGLYAHFSREHPEIRSECSHCLYLAKNREDLKEHQRNLCTARNLKCDMCGKTFYKKSTLNMHLRAHTNDRKYACTICSKAFLQSNDLANHMRTHTLERPFKCFQCDKRFKTIGQRIGHMSTHTTENKYKCDICHKNFKSARILHGHKKIHGERQFNCEVCEKKFSRRYHLTLHMKRHEKASTQKKKN